LSEFDSSRSTKNEDFFFTPILARTETRYQALLFNADLWFYEQIVSHFLKKFYQFSNFFANQSLDKAYFEYFYIEFSYKFANFFNNYNKYNFNSIEKAYPSSFFFMLSASILFFISFGYLWIASLVFGYEVFCFIYSFKHDDDKK
jgi:hypothetical protein